MPPTRRRSCRVIAGAGHMLLHDPRAIALLLGWFDRHLGARLIDLGSVAAWHGPVSRRCSGSWRSTVPGVERTLASKR